MKTSRDPRHIKRIKLIQELFAWQFSPKKKISKLIQPIVSKLGEIDKLIEKSAPGRPLAQINRVDLAILRLAIFELTKAMDIPPKVVVDEAVELGKEFGAQSSAGFVNGVLGKVIEIQKINT